MPSSGRYQSRVLSFFSQQSMQWRDRASKAARQTRLAMTWGVQMVLYPIYVLFQSGRLVGYQLRQAVTRLMPLLEAVKDDDFDPQVGAPPVSSDTPFYNTLAYLETFELPIILSPKALPPGKTAALPAAAASTSAGVETTLVAAPVPATDGWVYPAVPLRLDAERQSSLRLDEWIGRVNRIALPDAHHAQLAAASRALSSSGAIVPQFAGAPQWHLTIPPTSTDSSPPKGIALRRAIAQLRQSVVPIYDSQPGIVNVTQLVRGVACLLTTQALVLVDSHNQVLDILTPEQQLRLHQRIVLETASYSRRYRLQMQAQQAAERSRLLANRWGWRFLPPPKATAKTLPPVKAFQSLMGWVQSSPVAIATNLFQESALVVVRDPSRLSSPPISWESSPAGTSRSLPPSSVPLSGSGSFWRDLFRSMRRTLLADQGKGASPMANGSSPLSSTAVASGNLQSWVDPDLRGDGDGWFSANELSLARRQQDASPPVPSLPRRSRWMPDWASAYLNPGDRLDIDLAEDLATDRSDAPSSLGRSSGFPDPNDAADGVWLAAAQTKYPTRGQTRASTWDESATLTVNHDDPDTLVSTIVETRATLVGYVKHPLEQLLEWIDMGMVWIESLVEQVWSWLRSSDSSR